MRTSAVTSVVVLLILLVGTSVAGGNPPANHNMSPFLQIGPQAVSANVTSAVGNNYGLFTCQVNLVDFVCYDPYQMRHAYGTDALIAAGFDGRGKTIVIIDAFSDPYLIGDLNYFNTFYGLPSLNGLGAPNNPSLGNFSIVTPDGPPPANANWAGEITLDVEWAHAIAPGANIVLVEAKSNADADILSATKYAVDHNLGDVISQSFGENESCEDPALLTLEHQIFADATAKNITLFASAGDQGATQPNCEGTGYVKAASVPAADPLVTAVGGTELHAAPYCLTSLGCDPSSNPLAGTYQGEIVWNETAIGGEATGGGFSVVYDEPPYQKSTIHGGKQRGEADVSYNAATNHGVLVRFLNSWYLFGGTSAGSPQWAAITAITDEQAGHSLGYINTALYHLSNAKKDYAADFFDVTSGDNSFAGVTGFTAGPGWDAPTGLGSPVVNQISPALIQHVSAGDGTSAINTTKPHSNAKPNTNGKVQPN